MKFGAVAHPEEIDFSLPADAKETAAILDRPTADGFQLYVGCAKWNRTDLKGFYPKGTKDELTYYATQFNSIELNATFYNMPSLEQVESWKNKTPEGFRFCPKITNTISHYKRLRHVEQELETFCNHVAGFDDRLGSVFLQLHDNYGPKDFDHLKEVLTHFPAGIPLALELRNHQWYEDKVIAHSLSTLLEKLDITHILVDTAGRRDLLHMRLTNSTAFVRFVGANVPSDRARLDTWIERIADWKRQGLQTLYFFIHQNMELESPMLAAYFIEGINARLGTHLKVPVAIGKTGPQQPTLF